MDTEMMTIAAHLGGALLAGAIIGLERTFHARPAGFRTHTLVCLASSLLMLVTLYQWRWLPGVPMETVRTDPTRMAQGIMTGIGFLGAGVIFKESLSVRGLTTAASIWITSAIGILFGIGFWFPAILATVLTLGILSLFRSIEAWMPQQTYVHHHLRFGRYDAMTEGEVRAMVGEHGFLVSHMSYRADGGDSSFEYRMVLRTSDPDNAQRLADTLRSNQRVRAFRISPTGD
jgi:putative Mg2+ transporter-C (MgtC) family protein